MLKEAAPDNAVLQIKSLEAFAKAADGQATKEGPGALPLDPSYLFREKGNPKSLKRAARLDLRSVVLILCFPTYP